MRILFSHIAIARAFSAEADMHWENARDEHISAMGHEGPRAVAFAKLINAIDAQTQKDQEGEVSIEIMPALKEFAVQTRESLIEEGYDDDDEMEEHHDVEETDITIID